MKKVVGNIYFYTACKTGIMEMKARNGDAATAETVSGLILQAASVLGYLLAEGLADAGNATIE